MKRLVAFALTGGLSGLFLLDLCNWLFACGCRNWYAGAVTHCNIHLAHGPHCPWCSIGALGFWSLFAAMILAQALILWLPSRLTLPLRLLAALASFPLLGWVTRLLLL